MGVKDDEIEQALQLLESVANFMRGMQLDPSIGFEQKNALGIKAREIDDFTEKHA